MREPFAFSIKAKFKEEFQVMKITIMRVVGDKYKKIAHGSIKIFKKYLSIPTHEVEKWISLTLYNSQVEYLLQNKLDLLRAEIETGKIFMIILFPQENTSTAPSSKIAPDQKYLSIAEKSNELLQKIKQRKLSEDNEDVFEDIDNVDDFDDNVSDTSISFIDNDSSSFNLDAFLTEDEDLANEFREGLDDIDNNAKNAAELLQFSEALHKKFSEIKAKNSEIISGLKNDNALLRKKITKIFSSYKDAKHRLQKSRKNYQTGREKVREQININKEEDKKILGSIKSMNTEIKFFKHEMNIDDNAGKGDPKNMDLNVLSNILKKVHGLGYDIFTGSGLSSDERQKIKHLLNLDENVITRLPQEEEEEMKDVELGNKIVKLIEDVVNDLFLKQKINNVKIDQINASTYCFEDKKTIMEVILKIENDSLYCVDGTPFSVWLLKNFKA